MITFVDAIMSRPIGYDLELEFLHAVSASGVILGSISFSEPLKGYVFTANPGVNLTVFTMLAIAQEAHVRTVAHFATLASGQTLEALP